MTERQKHEIIQVRKRVREDLFTSPLSIFTDDPRRTCSIAEYEELSVTDADGTCYFADLNYAPENRTCWGATVAAYRLINLLKLGECAGKEEKQRAQALALAHLEGFMTNGYTNLNWWHLCIGIPQTVVRLLIMLEDALSERLYGFLLSLTERGCIVKDDTVLSDHKGANLIWFCDTSILHALLTYDADELLLAVRTIEKETYGREDAGLQADGSFFQHGRLLYSLGYGRAYVMTLAPLLYYLGGSSFAFGREALENIFSHILDGIRHMTHRRGFDYLTMGREYLRFDATVTDSVEIAMAYLAKLPDVPREKEIKAFYQALRDGVSPITANKYFSVARFLTHQEEQLYVSFKALDETLLATEICNGENVLGVHLSYATSTCVMHTGEEYRNVAPLLRYDYMPGTTCAEESDEAMVARFAAAMEVGNKCKPDVILASGGDYGDISVSLYRFRHDGITESASCIATPYGVLRLGSGSHDGTKTLHTTLEQCNLQGEVSVSEDGTRVTHNGVCYVNHASKALISSVTHRVGSFRRNSPEDIPHEGDVFMLYTEHQGHCFDYAYEILTAEKGHLTSQILENSAEAQRVRLADGREVFIRLCDGAVTVLS